MTIASEITAWCVEHLGSEPRRELFRVEHLSRVVGLELSGGQRIVLKVRAFEERLEACTAVQRHLFDAGFPCPRPLIGPVRVGKEAWSAEAYVAGGEFLAPGPDSPDLLAKLLRRVVELAPAPDAVPSLAPSPPWVAWDHAGEGPWPLPDDLPLDMNGHSGPDWLDDLARRVRERMRRHELPHVVGHGDWELQNLRWVGREPLVVHDWDSVVSMPEAALAGAASSIYLATPQRPLAATLAESAAFIVAYGRARGGWTQDEVEVAWAAGLWTLAFDAKKAVIRGNQPERLRLLESELELRSRLAGITR